MATAWSPLLLDRQQPSSNECFSANCKKITGFLIAPFIVLVLDAISIYNLSSISHTMFQNFALFHMVKALILIILSALFVYAVYHPEKRDIFWLGGIITVLLLITNFIYMIYIIGECGPNYNSSLLNYCRRSIMFPIFGTFAMIFVPFAAFIGYDSLGR